MYTLVIKFETFKMNIKNLILPIVFGLMTITISAQACIINVGSENSKDIIEIFQLKEDQLKALEVFKSDLNVEINDLENQVAELLKTHPQSNPNELLVLAKKHRDLEDKMFAATIKYDQKLISLFNEKQYERYVLLCNTANRTPISILQE
tara:strand:- start:5155 stop:5604 length:450 start_codon:yes stop_codon:yes gene_type:complete